MKSSLRSITENKLQKQPKHFFQILQLLAFILYWDYGFSLKITQDNNLELALCHLVRHTPNYAIFKLDQTSNCLAQVASFKNNIICLRNNENQVHG